MRQRFLHLITLFAAAVSGQVPVQPRFAVVSIKECADGMRPPPSTSSPGRLSLSCRAMWRLIGEAYDTFVMGAVDPLKQPIPQRPEGGPGWMDSARYTIDAKAEGPQSAAMMRGPMMQAVLEERFRLKIHRETREVPGYVMTVDKRGLKLPLTAEGSCDRLDPTNFSQSPTPADGKPWCLVPRFTREGPMTTLDMHDITLDGFATFLLVDGLPVFNQTGVSGAFDIHLEWEADLPKSATPDANMAGTPFRMSLIQATQEQLGLRLQRGAGSRQFLVVDHLERPSRN